MAHLSLSLLGPFQAALREAGQPVTGFESAKVRALLAYLAVEADRPHPREALAGLLWPDYADRSALNNLRSALANLRQAIGDRQAEPPFLLITRDSIQFNTASDYDLDLKELQDLRGVAIDRLERAVALYRGSFLEGFSCDSAPFEEWILLRREQINRQVLDALCRLAAHYEECGEYERAITYARKQLELEPWDEAAHRQLMRALALAGQRSAALAQYDLCCRVLKQELGIEPSRETTALCESIRDEALVAAQHPRAPTPTEEFPSQTIKDYELIEPIGQGAFGVIYRARQRHVDRQVAIKVILPEHANQPDFIRRFEVEAQLVAQLEHLHIVPLYDYWREPDGAYLVMRLMKGGSLEKLLEHGPLPLNETAQILDQIGSALAAAHRQGVIHRDLKPANILLDEEGNAFLSDFGIAKAPAHNKQTRVTATGEIVGTPAYISPEQLQSQTLTPQTDIYSLGVLLFETLTGQHPFKGSSTGDLLVKHLTTPLPSLREICPDLPAELDRVIQRATAKDPAERYAEVMALVDDVHRAITLQATTRPVAPAPELPLIVTNPYKGLRAFQEADALDFFGREALVQQLLARLAPSSSQGERPGGGDSRFLAVVGPSGSGKSSVVKAGLLPALRKGAVPGSDEWFVVEMAPGSHPFEELEIGLLRIATRPHAGLMEQLRRDARGLIRAARLVLPSDDSTLLLIVDQFEELFTLTHDKGEALHFMDCLYAAAGEPRGPVRIVITLRADLYDRPLMHPDFSALMSKHTQVVTPLTTDELARAITGPAERAGALLEAGLVTDIITDVKEQPGALPLLQYALTELFERRKDRWLTRQVYQSIGGVMGALGRRAEEVYAALDSIGQQAAWQLFLRLVTLGEGIEDTRRRVLRSELISLSPSLSQPPYGGKRERENTLTSPNGRGRLVAGQPGQEDVMDAVIEAFGRSRLLSFDRDPTTRGPTVEVAHEALLREWKRLREWLDAGRADVRLQRMLATAAADWRNAKSDSSFLLAGARLSQFEDWAANCQITLTPDEQAFLDASLAERQRREAEEAARQQRELEAARRAAEAAQKLVETEQRRAQEQIRAASALRRRAVFLTIALAVAAVLAVIAAAFGQRAQVASQQANEQKNAAMNAQATAVAEQGRAENQARIAAARELALAALNNLNVDPERSLLLGLQSASGWKAVNQPIPSDLQDTLHLAIQASRARLTWSANGEEILYVGFTPGENRPRAATGNLQENQVKVWDPAANRVLLTLPGRISHRTHIAFSPDGKLLAIPGEGNTIKIWDAASGQERQTLTGHTDEVYGSAFSPDGKLLASYGPKEEIIWDLASGQKRLVLNDPCQGDSSVTFSPDGTYVAFATGASLIAKVREVASGRAILPLDLGMDVNAIAFSPDGKQVAAAGRGNNWAKVWSIPSGSVYTVTLPSAAGQVEDLAFSPVDGKWLAIGTHLVEAASGKDLFDLLGQTSISHLAFNGEGTSLTTASYEGTVKTWDLTPSHEVSTLWKHAGPVLSLAFSADGKRLVTGGGGNNVAIVWELPSGRVLHMLAGHTGAVNGVAFSPDGKWVATASADLAVVVWDAETGQVVRKLTGHTAENKGKTNRPTGVVAVAFDPGCTLARCPLAGVGMDGQLIVWDASSGQMLFAYQDKVGGLKSLAYSPDGKLVAVGNTGDPAQSIGTATILDATTGQVVRVLPGDMGWVFGLAFSSDGKRLATTYYYGMTRVWDVATGEALVSLQGPPSYAVAFSPAEGGTRLATNGNEARLWDVGAGQPLLTLNTLTGYAIAFSPEGTYVATAHFDGSVRLYVVKPDDLLALARSRVTRPLSIQECNKYLHIEQCPVAP